MVIKPFSALPSLGIFTVAFSILLLPSLPSDLANSVTCVAFCGMADIPATVFVTASSDIAVLASAAL